MTGTSKQVEVHHLDDQFAVGFRVANPDAPVSEPRRFEPLNPQAQAKADRLFREVREEALATGK
jgi:hypothetical protein